MNASDVLWITAAALVALALAAAVLARRGRRGRSTITTAAAMFVAADRGRYVEVGGRRFKIRRVLNATSVELVAVSEERAKSGAVEGTP